MSLEKGDVLPSFTGINQEGEPFTSTSLKGKPVVIYFYPKNFTPGCTQEACSFRDSYQDFQDQGAEVVGISGDTVASHVKFASKYNLPFTLLADTDKKLRKKFGVKSSLLGLLPGRETFVFDASGVLVFKFNSLAATAHITKALKYIKQHG